MRKEFCQLAHKLDLQKHGVGHRYLSSKLDGFRVLWDGGVSRGLLKSEVPWANLDKDERYLEAPRATGLWSRYGNVVHAPDWFLDGLTNVPFDGEIWCPGMSRQDIRSIAAKLVPGDDWEQLSYHVYGIPVPSIWLADGRVNTPNFEKNMVGCYQWYLDKGGRDISNLTFGRIFKFLDMLEPELGEHVLIHPQERLPFRHDRAMEIVEQRLAEEMLKPHAEGLMLVDGAEPYQTQRTETILKVKPRDDAEATVVGYVTGKETDRGSKLLGVLGALILDYQGKRLELAGFNMSERELSDSGWAERNPGKELPDDQEAIHFPRGMVITFQYRGLTDAGIPAEAQYWRKHEEL